MRRMDIFDNSRQYYAFQQIFPKKKLYKKYTSVILQAVKPTINFV